MTLLRLKICCASVLALSACAEDRPPSPDAFMADSRLLEATMVRCNQDRAKLKYTPECVNAREAINRIEVAAKRARHEELEAQSIRKRQALRQTQQAAAEARRLAEEAQRQQEEYELLGLYEETPAEPTGETVPPAGVVMEQPAQDLSAIREELQRRQQEPQ